MAGACSNFVARSSVPSVFGHGVSPLISRPGTVSEVESFNTYFETPKPRATNTAITIPRTRPPLRAFLIGSSSPTTSGGADGILGRSSTSGFDGGSGGGAGGGILGGYSPSGFDGGGGVEVDGKLEGTSGP